MKRAFRITAWPALLTLALALAAAAPAAAQSLWSDTVEPLYTDGTAKFVGDIVTIVVSETTRASTEASTDVSQQHSMQGSQGTGILGKFFDAFGIDTSDQYEASGSTDKRESLVTTISAEVMEVLPNGNLYIEARRSIVINEETQMVVLSGVIRTRDISGANTIASNKISNAQITYTGRGPIARRQRPGVLSKVFNWIF
jgi:flagellar L-ring protein precursor FlgH